MLPVEERSLGNADAFGELALRQARLRPELGDINHRHLNDMDARAGVFACRKCNCLIKAFNKVIACYVCVWDVQPQTNRVDLNPHCGHWRAMTRTLISSGSPFETQVGYSRAVVDGDWCWVAGTTGYDPQTRIMPDDVNDQAANAFKVIAAALAEGGFSLEDAVRVTYYISDARYWDEVGATLGAAFGTIRPAAACIVCGLVKPEMKIEIEVTAKKRS